MCVFTDLDQIKDILNKATKLLCDFLDPYYIVIALKLKQHLKTTDQQEIRHCSVMPEKVDRLLTILQRKRKEAYFAFMVALRKERPDLFTEVIKIECTFTLGMENDISFFSSIFYNHGKLKCIRSANPKLWLMPTY